MAKKKNKNLNLRDLEVMKSQEIDHDTYPETMEKVGICRDTIAQTKKKDAYRELVIAALEQEEVTATTFAQNLKKLMEAKRTINIGGSKIVVDDNITRFNAVKKHGDILGVDAPKDLNLKGSLVTMGDDELRQAIDESIRGTYGDRKNSTSSTRDARPAKTDTAPKQKSSVAGNTGK